MAFIKQNKIRLVACALLTVFVVSLLHFSLVSAEDAVKSPEKSTLDSISQNCASIKQSLSQLQRADSRTRTYLGTAYQTISTNFIAPLAARLARNNYDSPEIMQIQADYLVALTDFRSAYTDYMRDLELLIATDCQAHPADFYEQLATTRTRRATLAKLSASLSKLTAAQIDTVTALREELIDAH